MKNSENYINTWETQVLEISAMETCDVYLCDINLEMR